MIYSNKTLGAKLQECRESKKITQLEMAKAVGHSKNYISALEHGTNKMSAQTLIAYADKLDMSIDEMIGHEKPDNKILPELCTILKEMNQSEQKKLLRVILAMQEND